jgi:hypothetical protein
LDRISPLSGGDLTTKDSQCQLNLDVFVDLRFKAMVELKEERFGAKDAGAIELDFLFGGDLKFASGH